MATMYFAGLHTPIALARADIDFLRCQNGLSDPINNYTIVRRWGEGGGWCVWGDILRPNTALNSSYNILPSLYVIVEKLEKKKKQLWQRHVHSHS